MKLAPIVLFVYNRVNNTRETIEALVKNPEAKDSELFIFCDGAKNSKDRIEVEKVKKYIKTISGFKSIEISENQYNKGLANSIIEGVNKILDKYESVIVLEDDIVVSRTFLEFMNKALIKYNKRTDIWSISGYSPKIKIPNKYTEDIFINIRGASWGWATWKDRWKSIDWELKNLNKFFNNKDLVKEFDEAGDDLSRMLYEYLYKRIDSWAIRWYYAQFKEKKFTVFPTKSLIRNEGFNYSGTHGANKKLAERINTEALEFRPNINEKICGNEEINHRIKDFYDISFTRRLIFLARKYGFYKIIRLVKKLMIIKK